MKCLSGSLLPILLLVSLWCMTACGDREPNVSAETQATPTDLSGPVVVQIRSEEVRITADRIDWRWVVESPELFRVKARSTRRIQLTRVGGPADTVRGAKGVPGSVRIEIHLTAEAVGKGDGAMSIRSDILIVGEESVYVKGPVVRDMEAMAIRRQVVITTLSATLDVPGEYTLYTIGGEKALLVIR